MSRLRVARSAVADLDEIWLYIARRESPEAAERFVNLLTGKFALLLSVPAAGRNRPELGDGVRSFPVRNYRIYYRHEPGIVRVLHVRHTARDESKLIKENP